MFHILALKSSLSSLIINLSVVFITAFIKLWRRREKKTIQRIYRNVKIHLLPVHIKAHISKSFLIEIQESLVLYFLVTHILSDLLIKDTAHERERI